MPPAAIIGGAALVGGIAGSMGKKSQQTSTVDAGNATGSEQFGQDLTMGNASELSGLVARGPGAQDVSAATGSSRDLASMLDAYSKGGFNPSQTDITQSNGLASQLFQGQRTALNQNFSDQNNQFNQQAALMGRDPTDPVFRNKLMQEQTRQQQQLDANQGGFATQLAMNSPLQKLQFAAQKNQVLGGLASQALANRQALAGMGEGIMTNERNFRLATASRSQDQSSGGGLGGFITGALGAAGAGFGIAQGFGGMGGGGGLGGSGGSPFSGAGKPGMLMNNGNL